MNLNLSRGRCAAMARRFARIHGWHVALEGSEMAPMASTSTKTIDAKLSGPGARSSRCRHGTGSR